MKTTKIKRVLIAMDYDETSQKVAEVGFSIAKAMNAETILLHVISEQPVYYSTYTYMRELSVDELSVDSIKDLKKSTQHFLDKAKKHLGDETIQTVLKEGEIAFSILETAKELNVDIIVMGSHSRKWLESIIMGSEAKNVLKNTTIPLFIVPTKNQNQ
jgi:nucleotide-binding universal stress UspA family protein